jgi:hypothetical protein
MTSDRDIVQMVFDALDDSPDFDDRGLTVSKMGDKIFIAGDGREWALAVLLCAND